MKVQVKPKKPVRRTHAQKIALATRISKRATIDKMLKGAKTIEAEIVKLEKKIENAKGYERKELVERVLKLNGQKGRLLIDANKLNRSISKK